MGYSKLISVRLDKELVTELDKYACTMIHPNRTYILYKLILFCLFHIDKRDLYYILNHPLKGTYKIEIQK